MKKPLYQAIASTLHAIKNCEESNNSEWLVKHTDRLNKLEKCLPSGSGFDSGCTIDIDASNPDKLVILAPYHHMDENGYYDGWNDYTVIVTPSLAFSISLRITGRDRNFFKEYAYEVFQHTLTEIVEEFPELEQG